MNLCNFYCTNFFNFYAIFLLASERLTSIPAKARLGMVKTSSTKQVTFDRITTVAHVKKPDVFSRLGI